MAQRTGIEWTDMSSNPIRAVRKSDGKRGHACVHASPGCMHCYSERWNGWRGTGLKFNVPALEQVDIILDEKELARVRRVKAGTKVFVCDMTDLFGPFVPDEYIAAVFAAMVKNDRVTWQVLTKRPERLASWVQHNLGTVPDHIWVGTSIENQEYADKRIPHLLRVPAAVRFLSCEPLLGPVDLSTWLYLDWRSSERKTKNGHTYQVARNMAQVNWVIVGGESGPQARPIHPAWVRSLRDQCKAAGVAFFMKQWGEWSPGEFTREGTFKGYWQFQRGSTFHEETHGTPEEYSFQGPPDGNYRTRPVIRPWPDVACLKLGKTWSGRLLDGKEWNEFPTPAERELS